MNETPTPSVKKPIGVYAALAKAQSQIGTVAKDSKADVKTNRGPGYGYSYASLPNVLDAVRAPLAQNELALVQRPHIDQTWVTVESVIYHSDGSHIQCAPSCQARGTDPQSIGSAITYLRRYGLMSLLALAADDDDGQAAMPQRGGNQGNNYSNQRSEPQRRPRPRENYNTGPLPANDHPAVKSRNNHPATMELPTARQEAAPQVPPPRQAVTVTTQDNTPGTEPQRRRMFAHALNHMAWTKDQLTEAIMMGGSTKALTGDEMDEVCVFCMRVADVHRCQSSEDWRNLWTSLARASVPFVQEDHWLYKPFLRQWKLRKQMLASASPSESNQEQAHA